MKAGEGNKVHRGEESSGICQEEISIDEKVNISLSESEQKLETSHIESIKACSDGSYIVETTTSFYRLNIAD